MVASVEKPVKGPPSTEKAYSSFAAGVTRSWPKTCTAPVDGSTERRPVGAVQSMSRTSTEAGVWSRVW